MATEITIRPIQSADAAAVARLVTQLGYPSSEAEIAERLAALSRQTDHFTFVAEEGGRIVGLAGAYLDYALEFSGAYGRLTGLVVDEACRGRGIGRRLMAWIEDWLRGRGAVQVTLTSGRQRGEAHAFYRSLGYEETGLRFAKSLQRVVKV